MLHGSSPFMNPFLLKETLILDVCVVWPLASMCSIDTLAAET